LIQVNDAEIEKLCSSVIVNPKEYIMDQMLFDSMTISSPPESGIELCQRPDNWFDWFHFTEMKTVVKPDSLEGYLKVNGSTYDKKKRVDRSMMMGRLFQLIHIACQGKIEEMKKLIKQCLQCETDQEVHEKSFMVMPAPNIESCARMNFRIDHNTLKAILLSVVFNFPMMNCPLLHSTTGLFYSNHIIADLTSSHDKAFICLISASYLDRVRIYLSELKPDIGEDWFYPVHKTSGFKKLAFYWPDSKRHFSIQSGSDMTAAILSLFKETSLTQQVDSFLIPKCFLHALGKPSRDQEKSILDHFPKFDNKKIYYPCGFNDFEYILKSKFAAYPNDADHYSLVGYRTNFCHGTKKRRKRARTMNVSVVGDEKVHNNNNNNNNSSESKNTPTTDPKSKKQKTKK
jgi:hypothetical protein